MKKEITVQEIRNDIFRTERKLRKAKIKNKLKRKYHAKITYMLMHLRMIPMKKVTMGNWHMPDYSDIMKLEKKPKPDI